MGGILQGLYAFTGIVRSGSPAARGDRAGCRPARQRAVRALAAGHRARRRPAARQGTPHAGRRSVRHRAQGTGAAAASRPRARRGERRSHARSALDNWLTWQFRHTAVDATGVAGLAAAYQRGEPLGGQALPESWIEDDVRKVDSIPSSRLLNMRYQEPERYRQLSATDHRRARRGRRPPDPWEHGRRGSGLPCGARRRAGPGRLDRPGAGDSPAPRGCHHGRYSPLACRSYSKCTRTWPGRESNADPLELAAWFE